MEPDQPITFEIHPPEGMDAAALADAIRAIVRGETETTESSVTNIYEGELPMFTIDQQLRITALQSACGLAGFVTPEGVVAKAEEFYKFLSATPS